MIASNKNAEPIVPWWEWVNRQAQIIRRESHRWSARGRNGCISPVRVFSEATPQPAAAVRMMSRCYQRRRPRGVFRDHREG